MSEEFENVFLQIRPQWKNDRREDVFRKFVDASERLNGKYVIQEVQFAFEVWSASQAREAELRKELGAETNLKNLYRGELEQTADQRNELTKKLEAAEARIKASQEQEPFDYVYRGTEPVPTFLQPPIPPELAELQRENAALKAWKNAVIDACVINCMSWDEADARKTLRNLLTYEQQIALDPLVSSEAEALIERGRAELRKLLESKVPSSIVAGALYDFVGWLTTRRTEITMSDHHDAGIAVSTLIDFAKMRGLLLDHPAIEGRQARLAAAPQPKEPKI